MILGVPVAQEDPLDAEDPAYLHHRFWSWRDRNGFQEKGHLLP